MTPHDAASQTARGMARSLGHSNDDRATGAAVGRPDGADFLLLTRHRNLTREGCASLFRRV